MGSGGDLRARLNRPALERSFCKVPSKPIEQNERGERKRMEGMRKKARGTREKEGVREIGERGKKEKKGKGKRERELSSANKNLEGFLPFCSLSLNALFVKKRAFFIFWSTLTGMSRVCPEVWLVHVLECTCGPSGMLWSLGA